MGLTFLSFINQVLSSSIPKEKSSVLEYAFTRSEFSVYCINEQDEGGLEKKKHTKRQLGKKAEKNNAFEVFQKTANGFKRHL